MSEKDKSSKGWVNNFIQMWRTKDNDKKFFLSMPLAEPVTLKLQRKTRDGNFIIEEVTLVPQTNDKGYSSVMFPLKKVEAYQNNGETITPPENLRQVASVPPGAQGDGQSDF